MPIRLITLDLDNTLWDVDRIIIRAEQDMRDWMKANTPLALDVYHPESVAPMREAVVEEFPEHRHDLSFMRTQVLTKVMVAAGYVEDATVFANTAFDVFFEGRNRIEFFDGALEMLAQLSARLPIYALTNGNADIEKAGLGPYLSGAYSSASVGASKPAQAMFEAPLRDLDINASETVHIGDNPIDDVEGANDAGMHTIWVNLTEQDLDTTKGSPPTATVTDLRQIPAAILALD